MNIDKLIADLKAGVLSEDAFKKEFLQEQLSDMGDVVLDLQRESRCGIPEVVFGQAKSTAQIITAAKKLLEKNDQLLVTRVAKESVSEIMAELESSGCIYDESANAVYKLNKVNKPGRALVLTAGTSDLPVGREAQLTCQMFGFDTELKADVGVAGLNRLLSQKDLLLSVDVIIVCAGMEGALPSVVGGLVKVPVIAVPVSTGYGTSFSGVTALFGMLNSCASGLTVVNVDNGFGAGYAAGRILLGRVGS